MRVLVVMSGLVGCGRVGFDTPAARTDAVAAADSDGKSAACSAMPVVGLNVPGPASDIVAAELPTGFALGFLNSPSSALQGVVLDGSLVPNWPDPVTTSPVGGFTYSGASLYWDGTNLAGSASVVEDDSCYFKTFMPDMSTFLVAVQRFNCRRGEPSVARAGADVVSTYFSGADHSYAVLDATGNPTGSDLSVGSSASTVVSASLAPGDPTALLVTGTDTAQCEVFTIPSAASATLTGQCIRPRAYSGDAGNEFYVTYEAAGSLFVRVVRDTGGINLGTQFSLGTVGTKPQLMTSKGTRYVVFEIASGLGARRLGATENTEIVGLPAGAPDAFEVSGPYVFAAYGSTLYAVQCPP